MHIQAKGFSLIELLVVVAIIAVLAGIGIPIYQAYTVKVKINTTFANMAAIFQQTVVTTYERTGSFPTSISVNGTTVTAGSPGFLGSAANPGIANLSSMYYLLSSDSKGAGFYLKLTPITGFFTSTTNGLSIGVRDINGTTKFACGISQALQALPSNLNPSTCTCNDVGLANALSNSFIENGTGC